VKGSDVPHSHITACHHVLKRKNEKKMDVSPTCLLLWIVGIITVILSSSCHCHNIPVNVSVPNVNIPNVAPSSLGKFKPGSSKDCPSVTDGQAKHPVAFEHLKADEVCCVNDANATQNVPFECCIPPGKPCHRKGYISCCNQLRSVFLVSVFSKPLFDQCFCDIIAAWPMVSRQSASRETART
jgi:hypothetical protein